MRKRYSWAKGDNRPTHDNELPFCSWTTINDGRAQEIEPLTGISVHENLGSARAREVILARAAHPDDERPVT